MMRATMMAVMTALFAICCTLLPLIAAQQQINLYNDVMAVVFDDTNGQPQLLIPNIGSAPIKIPMTVQTLISVNDTNTGIISPLICTDLATISASHTILVATYKCDNNKNIILQSTWSLLSTRTFITVQHQIIPINNNNNNNNNNNKLLQQQLSSIQIISIITNIQIIQEIVDYTTIKNIFLPYDHVSFIRLPSNYASLYVAYKHPFSNHNIFIDKSSSNK